MHCNHQGQCGLGYLVIVEGAEYCEWEQVACPRQEKNPIKLDCGRMLFDSDWVQEQVV